jgi:hypothetical protein
MKKAFLIAAIFSAQFISAQVSKNLGDFTTVKVFDQIDVILVKSDKNSIEIKGSGADDVEVVTKNNDLKIRMKLSKLLQGDNVSATVYYTGSLNGVEASEGARVASGDTFSGTAFELNAKEGAEIRLELDVQKLKSKAASGGILKISGSADNHDAAINSGGILEAEDLVTKQTVISITAGGEADIHATDYVDAKTKAGGDINIYGNPQKVDKNQFAGGSIKVSGE